MFSLRPKLLGVFCGVLLLILVVPLRSQAPAPVPGVSEGQKIGTIIKTAITTAAPGISSFMSIFDTVLSAIGKNKASKDDVTTAATKPAVQAAAKQPQVNAQQAILPISKVSDELGVINKFLNPSVTASQYLIIVRTKMGESPTDWTEIGNKWALAKIQIGNLKSIPDTDLTKIRDAYLSLKLGQMRSANDTVVVQIQQEVDQKNLAGLKEDVSAMLSLLANMTAVAGFELAELQADIGDLVTWAKGGAGGGATTPARKQYVEFLNTNLH